MWQLARWTLGWFARLVLSLRYRVTVRGHEALRELDGPVLVLPNHPGYIDPALVLTNVRPNGPLRPLVYSGTYRVPFLYPLMRIVDAFEVPEMAQQSRGSHDDSRQLVESAVEAIESGDNLLIYPSGRLQRRGEEVVGAARVVHEIVRSCPDVNVVLVRTRGVWGSQFTFAQTASLPNLAGCLLRGIGYLLGSLFFLLPRRRITMEVEVVDRSSLPLDDRRSFNASLEQWYNVDGPEPPTYVPYHLVFGRRTFDFPEFESGGHVDLDDLTPETVAAVLTIVEEHLRRPLDDEERTADTTLDQIGLDSLDRMDIALAIEDRFGFRSDEVASTIGELCALADGRHAGGTSEPRPTPRAWLDGKPRRKPLGVDGETVPEAFLNRVLADPAAVAVADETSGVLTSRRLLVAVELFARRIREIEAEHVGIMLPASVATDIVYLAIGMAGKTPVLLNWTTGSAGLEHAIKVAHLTHVVTAEKLVDRLGIEVEGAEFLFLERLREGISKRESLFVALRARLRAGSFRRGLPKLAADDVAAILFTSGSESAPKAVPLTHRNVLENSGAGLVALAAEPRDSLLGFLPPFHSFGLTGNMLMPILGGVPVVHSPDPTAARHLVEAVSRYRVTLLFTTPTFLGYMLAAGSPDDVGSLRLVVTGAEKTPDGLYDDLAGKSPEAMLLEGYGITECSPVVACNTPTAHRRGSVGRPLENVDVVVRDLETGEVCGTGQSGMIYAAGPSIFGGYHAFDGPSPFETFDGRAWYKTGDLGTLDEDGFLTITGRLKRFLKSGGEMISLPALEQPFAKAHPADENGPRCAVEGVEVEGGRRIVLFTTFDLELREANALLAEAGFRGIMRLDEVHRINAIPTLGTGKTDYRALRELVLESS